MAAVEVKFKSPLVPLCPRGNFSLRDFEPLFFKRGEGEILDGMTRELCGEVLSQDASPHFSQRDYIEGGKRRGYFHLDDPGGSALLSRRQRRNWTPIAAIRLCTSQCPIRRRSDSLVADSADNPQIARLNHRLQFVGAGPTPVGIA